MPMVQRPPFFRMVGKSSIGLSISTGALCGLILICAITPMRLMLGTNHEVDTAMILTAALCYCAIRSLVNQESHLKRLSLMTLPLAACWTLALPVLLQAMLRMAHRIPLGAMEGPVLAYGMVFGMSLICLLPVFMTIRISHRQAGQHGNTTQWQWLLGLSLACLILPTLVLPFAGTKILAWIALVGAMTLLIIQRHNLVESGETVPAASEAVPLEKGWLPLSIAILTGGALALTAFTAAQLIPRNLTGDMALFAGIVAGVSCAMARRTWSATSGLAFSTSLVCLFLAAWTSIVAAGYPVWTLLCLKINAWVENIGLIFALRMCLLMLLALPAGFVIRRVAGRTHAVAPSPVVPVLIAAGFIVAPWFPCTPRTTAACLIIMSLILTLIAWAREKFRLPQSLLARLGTAGLACSALIGLFFSGNLDPNQSARVLFSGSSLQSLRQGVPARQLNWLDDTRCLADFTSLTDHVSLWRTHGTQVMLRRSGMPSGLHSSDTAVCPHHAGDLMPVALPLVMHPQPENVLILGAHPASLLACHAWPLRSVRTVDGSQPARQMLHWLVTEPAGGLNLHNGPAFQFSNVDPVLALYGQHSQRYDLIACPITHPSAASTPSRITQEFYTQARRHLSDDGIFSQRIPYYDLGPGVLERLISTLQSTFSEVRAIEAVPGELIFICSAGKLPDIDEQFVDRLKLPQNRFLLAQAGWDWTLVLGRGAIDNASLRKLSSKNSGVNCCDSNSLAFWLPLEISRWGRKADASRQALASVGGALRTELGETAAGKEVTERLEDLSIAHRIQREHPNDPWAYRAALKSRLQDRPRTTIMQVNHQLKRVINPEDQRRKDYLQSLGATARLLAPPVEEIEKLAEYRFPFDPLVSFFVYYETANLLNRSEAGAAEKQLQHLLHTVYYSTGFDQSVRNASQALELLTQEEVISLSDADRWDRMNSLMQTLAQRWQLRLDSNSKSKYELTDTETSLTAIETSMQSLGKHYAAAGLTKTEWTLRKQILEQALVKPLRQHRSENAREIRMQPVLKSEG